MLTLFYKVAPSLPHKNKSTDLLEAVDMLLKTVRVRLEDDSLPPNLQPSPKAEPDELCKAIDLLLQVVRLELDHGDAPPNSTASLGSRPDGAVEMNRGTRLDPPLPPIPVLHSQLGRGDEPPPNPPPSPKSRPEEAEHILRRSNPPPPPSSSLKAKQVEDSAPDTPPPSPPSRLHPCRLTPGADNAVEPLSPPLTPTPHDSSVHMLGRGDKPPPPNPPPSPKAKPEETSSP